MTRARIRYPAIPALAAALLALAACTPEDDQPFPLAKITPMDLPRPTKPLFDEKIVTAASLLPHAKPQVWEPLPPMVPLPTAQDIDAAPKNVQGRGEGGAVNPAAGQAAAISDGQGEGGKQVLGAPRS